MSPDDWQSQDDPEKPIDAWFRHRYEEGPTYVLDVDKLICDRWVTHGVLIELKHVGAKKKRWRVTSTLAIRLGWWAALIEHDGSVPLFITLAEPSGRRIDRQPFDSAAFDAWVCTEFGATLRDFNVR